MPIVAFYPQSSAHINYFMHLVTTVKKLNFKLN
jgi:hypothetical protein